ncbi:hypothetical protein SNOG_12463 [Parastagonospora nodorum SN15]|uniref:Uncharacterized protein n=1 Tax=Phaeosphaeria nodorum (strain SN15 / ATCC MYA-4574 / FGSC 10173) TaxID=321614 RepID=Q0U701_PHANO|nr:hypothetical protein SNOG_12463 [Parastagonospora nodorum SN15]EAT80276.1 hypothetical protein SNOG_12463 [Parastagonospora nodorum SN15]
MSHQLTVGMTAEEVDLSFQTLELVQRRMELSKAKCVDIQVEISSFS